MSSKYTRNDTLNFFNQDELATDVFLKKYALTQHDGVLEEYLPSQMWERLANAAAKVEKDSRIWVERFYNILCNWKAVPQGSIMFALGNPYQNASASNCYVLPIKDDSLEGIFDCAKEMSQTYAYRGGVGIDISSLRPAGSIVSNAARTSTGAWSFMDFFSYVTRLIGQHGRRGALMITINDTHPDLLNFITAKKDKTKVTGANISVKLSDAFMNAVENDLEWELFFTTKHESISRKMPARQIWDLIISTATETAEPGVMFWDTMIRESPGDCYADEGFASLTTNPCITADNWVITSDGPRQVSQLIGKKFNAIVDGKSFPSGSSGFFLTGTKEVIEVVTDRGYSVKCTPNHKIKRVLQNCRGLKTCQWVEASTLRVGDVVNLNNVGTNLEWNSQRDGDNFQNGWLIGYLQGDGTYSTLEDTLISHLDFWGDEGKQIRKYAITLLKNSGLPRRSDCGQQKVDRDRSRISSVALSSLASEFGVYPSKELDEKIQLASSDFYRGFLQGWFDADGCVNLNDDNQTYSIRLSSIHAKNLKIAQQMLARLGVMSTLYTNRKSDGDRMLPDGKGGYKEYTCRANHELHIGKDNMLRFVEQIGFGCENKRNRLANILANYRRGPYKECFTAQVVAINQCATEPVYDCQIEDCHEFDANGISVHNCSEILLPAYDACTLLSMNLTKYTKNDFSDEAYFDFDRFQEDTAIATRFLDNVKQIDLGMMPLKQQRDIAKKGRRIGMGTHGLADTLANLCIRYDSDEALSFIGKLYEFYAKAVYGASIELAKEKGVFPIFDASKEKKNPFLNRIGVAGIPRRNIACLTCAPTGTVSCLSQTSSGIEPVFRNFYTRRRKITHNESTGIPKSKLYQDKLGDLWQEYTVAHQNVQRYLEINHVKNIEDVVLPDFFVESNTIDWNMRVKIQATMQRFICHSISSTCNLPAGTPIETVKEIYMEAYKQGCKGFTVYVDGCRDGVLVTNQKDSIKKTDAPKRPRVLDADVYHITVKGQLYFVMVGLLNGDPYEVFAGQNGFIERKIQRAQIAKIKRGQYQAILEDGTVIENIADHITDEQAAITRLISLSLRHGSDIQHCVSVLERVPGDMQNFARCMARALKNYIPNNTPVKGRSCSECGSGNLIREEGCVRCLQCGNAKCG